MPATVPNAKNRQILLMNRPKGEPSESDFKLVEAPVPAPSDGEVLVQALYLSLDPYMRGRMSDRASYAKPVELGEVMTGGVVGRVIASQNAKFHEGDIVEGILGWQTYAISEGKGLRKIDPTLAPISTAVGVLGMPGLTAYFALLDLGKPKAGETVVVSAASGAVGGIVGQIAKLKGCRTVGTVGSQAKADYCKTELGFDACVNYRASKNLAADLSGACPDGVDVYFDNVGGSVTDNVFPLLNFRARIIICGQISQYNLEKPELGPRLLWHLVRARARVEGFLVLDYAERYKEGLGELARWVKEGKIKYREDITSGIENAPRKLIGLLKGENFGKALIKVAD
ncbi:MAG TPA: NADP-dependent oxidoreductase [Alphaproteobacteria bacterium]|nr:NADP-dependent oxidoreductase [Alphaproteobacteria bacterium]